MSAGVRRDRGHLWTGIEPNFGVLSAKGNAVWTVRECRISERFQDHLVKARTGTQVPHGDGNVINHGFLSPRMATASGLIAMQLVCRMDRLPLKGSLPRPLTGERGLGDMAAPAEASASHWAIFRGRRQLVTIGTTITTLAGTATVPTCTGRNATARTPGISRSGCCRCKGVAVGPAPGCLGHARWRHLVSNAIAKLALPTLTTFCHGASPRRPAVGPRGLQPL